MEICEAEGVGLVIPKSYFFTLTNSPYHAHRFLSAVDIYPRGREMESPFEGRLIFHEVRNGEHICGFSAGEAYVRALHMEPAVKVGDSFERGDLLGYLRDSPTFRPWTDPHVHFEIRRRPEFLRARGGSKLRLGRDLLSRLEEIEWRAWKGVCEVLRIVRGGYVLLDPRISGLTGFPVELSHSKGFLEGGLPYYGHAGVYALRGSVESPVFWNGVPVARPLESTFGYTHVVPLEIRFSIEKTPLLGISLYANLNLVKAIPSRWDLNFEEGDEVVLSVEGPHVPGRSTGT